MRSSVTEVRCRLAIKALLKLMVAAEILKDKLVCLATGQEGF